MSKASGKGKQVKYTIVSNAKDEAVNNIIRELSMDGRKSLSSIADDTGISKTTVFNELNKLIETKEIRFVPEINLEDMWRHELLYTTKKMQKREFRDLDVNTIGFKQYLCFVKFMGRKPSDADVLKAIGNSYVPQQVSGLHGTQDLFMFLVARNFDDINAFVGMFNKTLSNYKMRIRVKPIQRTHGFFPLRNSLVEEFKIPEKYKKLLLTLNDDARGQMSKGNEMDKTMITYVYKTLLEYGIMSRTTLYMRNSDNNFTGIITFSIVDGKLFQKNKQTWYKHITTLDSRIGTYTYIADVYDPVGGFVIINARNSACFESIKKSIEGMNLGIKTGSMIVTRSIMGNMGIRNFDMKYSTPYENLANQGMVPKVEREIYARERRRKGPIYIEM